MQQEIKEELCGFGLEVESDDVLQDLQELADSYHKTASELADLLQIFKFNNKLVHVDTLTSSLVEQFKGYVNKEQAKENVKSRANVPLSEMFDSIHAPEPVTPMMSRVQERHSVYTPKSVMYTPASSFSKLLKIGEVLDKVNEDLVGIVNSDQRKDKLPVQVLSSKGSAQQKYLTNGMQKQLDAINDRIELFAQQWISTGQVEVVVPVYAAVLEQVAFVGRVCCDGQGKLNEASILLEGSIELSGGVRVKLNVSNLRQYRLFPGQIIGVLGTNPTGREIIAAQLKENMFPCEGYSDKLSVADDDIKIVVCAGPYTSQQDLAFEPLDEMLTQCRQKSPNVLILIGPFLDEDHPVIKLQDLDTEFEEIFQQQVVSRLQKFADSSPFVQVVLLASQRDVFQIPVYPTPAFDVKITGLNEDVLKLVGDPSVLALGGVSVAVTSNDVLKTLCTSQIQKGHNAADTLLYACAHLLGQQSFYPMFPYKFGQNLDLSNSPRMQLQKRPDLLILASDLKPFARQLQMEDKKVICMNIGRLCKGQTGTYAEVLVSAQAIQNNQCISDACKVEIKRI